MKKIKSRAITITATLALLIGSIGALNMFSVSASDGDVSSLPADYTYKTLSNFDGLAVDSSVYSTGFQGVTFNSSARNYIGETISTDGAYSGNGVKMALTGAPGSNPSIWTEFLPQGDPTVNSDFTGATDFSFYIDLTNYSVDDFSAQLYMNEQDYNADGTTAGTTNRVTKAGSTFYYQNESGDWVEGSVPTGSTNMHLPKNYKGFVRVPLTSLLIANNTSDVNGKFDLQKITDVSLITNVSTAQSGMSLTLDQYGFGGKITAENGGVRAPFDSTEPLPANYNYKTLSNFDGLAVDSSVYSTGFQGVTFNSSARNYIGETISTDGAYSGNGVKMALTGAPGSNPSIWTEFLPQGDPTVNSDFTGATDFSFYIDLTNYSVDDFSAQLYMNEQDYNADGTTAGTTNRVTKAGSTFYYQSSNGNWIEGTVPTGSTNMHLPKNYKGFVRVPLTSLLIANNTSDVNGKFDLQKITDVSLITNVSTAQSGMSLTLDQYGFGGSIVTGGVKAPFDNSPELPTTTTTAEETTTTTLEPTTTTTEAPVINVPDASSWKVGMVEDFSGMAAGAAYGNWGNYCKNVADAATAGVGFQSSQGLYVHSTAASEDTGYCQPWYAVFKKGDFSGAQELWIWYDYTNYGTPANVEIRPRINVDGSDTNIDLSLVPGSPVYLQPDSGTASATTVLDKSYIDGAALAGFKGFIRIPLTSFKPNADIDLTTANISQFAGMYNVFSFQFKTDDSEQYVETGYVMDNIAFVGPDMNSTLTVSDMLAPAVPTTTEPTTTEPTTTEPTTETTIEETTTVETTESTAPETTTSETAVVTTETPSTVSTTESSPAVTTSASAPATTESTLTSTTGSSVVTTVAPTTGSQVGTTASETAEGSESTTASAETTGTASPTTGQGLPVTALALALLAASGSWLLLKKKH